VYVKLLEALRLLPSSSGGAADEPARLLEIISPASFEQFFVERADLLESDPENLDATIYSATICVV